MNSFSCTLNIPIVLCHVILYLISIYRPLITMLNFNFSCFTLRQISAILIKELKSQPWNFFNLYNFLLCLGYQAQYPGQWPTSLSPGHNQYRTNPPMVNNMVGASPHSLNNSHESSSALPPNRSPMNLQTGQ